MAPKTKAKPAPKATVKAVAAKASAPMVAAMASKAESCATTCCGSCNGWGTATRLWWAVTWRTFAWVTLPLMLVQFGLAWLQTPELARGMFGFGMMMLAQLPSLMANLLVTPQFWFFVAVSAYSLLGAIYIYGYLARKGTFGGVSMTLTRTK
ncbi:MAG: hypothetical protein WAZ18_06545 [Alphaproteobacteria bacterium]